MHMFFYIYNIIHFLFDGNFTLQHIINNIILSTKSPLPKRTSQIAIKRLYNITWVRVFFLNSNPHTILFNNIVFLHTHIIFHVHCYYTFSSCNAGWVFFPNQHHVSFRTKSVSSFFLHDVFSTVNYSRIGLPWSAV